MILFRLILLGVIGFLLYRIYRAMGQRRLDAEQRRLRGEDMVQCRVCATHVPRAAAVASGGEWFCSQDHLQQHQRNRSDGD